jgi:hypothetical protein
MKRITTLLLALIVLAIGSASAQKAKRLQPGRLYSAGDSLYAPRFGFKAIVPAGWEGQLPRDVEVFLLASATGQGDIYLFGTEQGSIEVFRKNWTAGVALSESIKMKAGNDFAVSADRIESTVVLDGESVNKSSRGYAFVRCGPDGTCVTALAICQPQSLEAVKKTVQSFMTQARFVKPSNVSIYADFDWKEFLSGKMLMTYMVVESASKDTQLHLCADGTFMADIRKKGLMKNENPQYKGKLKGRWRVDGVGPQTKLMLTFDKGQPDIKATLTIADEKVTVEGERYFVSYSDYCNK